MCALAKIISYDIISIKPSLKIWYHKLFSRKCSISQLALSLFFFQGTHKPHSADFRPEGADMLHIVRLRNLWFHPTPKGPLSLDTRLPLPTSNSLLLFGIFVQDATRPSIRISIQTPYAPKRSLPYVQIKCRSLHELQTRFVYEFFFFVCSLEKMILVSPQRHGYVRTAHR